MIHIQLNTTFLTNKIPPAFALEIFLFAKVELYSPCKKKGGGASSRRLLANLPRPHGRHLNKKPKKNPL